MIEEIRAFFAPIGVIATIVFPFAARHQWKTTMVMREVVQMLRGVDGRNGLMGWKQEAEEKLDYAGVTLAQHGDRLARVEDDVRQVRDRYHKSANTTTEALLKLAEGKRI